MSSVNKSNTPSCKNGRSLLQIFPKGMPNKQRVGGILQQGEPCYRREDKRVF